MITNIHYVVLAAVKAPDTYYLQLLQQAEQRRVLHMVAAVPRYSTTAINWQYLTAYSSTGYTGYNWNMKQQQ